MRFRIGGLRASALLLGVGLCILPVRVAAQTNEQSPKVALSEAGATVEDVTIKTYGVIEPEAVRQYLSVKKGDALEQDAIDQDYANLSILGGFKPRLAIEHGRVPHTVMLHWIVMAKWFEPVSRSFYANQPLVTTAQGAGLIFTSPQVNARGGNVSANIYFGGDTYLVRTSFTTPLHVNPVKGSESDLIAGVVGRRNVYRPSEPAINVYSWITGAELLYFVHGTSGTQLELGLRTQRSTSNLPTGLVAPTLFQSNLTPARNTLLEAGYSHACGAPATQWYPPHCTLQYRFQISNTIGGFRSTSRYQTYTADIARYFSLGTSTLALHAAAERTGGVLPDSFLACVGVSGYPKAFCGTDAQVLQAEYRIFDEVPARLHFVLFTETAASRVRGGTPPFAPPNFQWWPDTGIGVIVRGFRLNLAYGKFGGRITYEFQGGTF